MDRWIGQVAVVTGGSTALGLAICQHLAEKGIKVIGLARKVDKIEELSRKVSEKKGKLFSIKCDVKKEEDIIKTFKYIKDHLGFVNILINNAALTRPINLTDGTTEDWRHVFDVNVIGLCICTRETIRVMKEQKILGHIININSTHYVNSTDCSETISGVYPASKFSVSALTETLRQELLQCKTNIKLTIVSPGVIRTESTESIPDNNRKNSVILKTTTGLKPQDVAEAVGYVLSTGPYVQIHELNLRPMGDQYNAIS